MGRLINEALTEKDIEWIQELYRYLVMSTFFLAYTNEDENLSDLQHLVGKALSDKGVQLINMEE